MQQQPITMTRGNLLASGECDQRAAITAGTGA